MRLRHFSHLQEQTLRRGNENRAGSLWLSPRRLLGINLILTSHGNRLSQARLSGILELPVAERAVFQGLLEHVRGGMIPA